MKITEIISKPIVEKSTHSSTNQYINESFFGDIKLLGIGKILFDTMTSVIDLNKELHNKKISQEDYNRGYMEQVHILMAQIISVMTSDTIVTFLTKLLKMSKLLPFGIGNIIIPILTFGGKAISSSVIAYISTDNGRSKFAELLATGFLSGVGPKFNEIKNIIISDLESWGGQALTMITTGEIPPAPGEIPKSPNQPISTIPQDDNATYQKYGYSVKSTNGGPNIAFNTNLPTGYKGPL